jgi:hypothetical protein
MALRPLAGAPTRVRPLLPERAMVRVARAADSSAAALISSD